VSSSYSDRERIPAWALDSAEDLKEFEMNRLCTCGSNKYSWWAMDARGIPLARVCEDCVKEKLSGYRTEVLVDPSYEADEPIEPEE
jgi:hypothetical protein